MPKYDLPRGVIMTPPLRRKYGVLPLRLARVNELFRYHINSFGLILLPVSYQPFQLHINPADYGLAESTAMAGGLNQPSPR